MQYDIKKDELVRVSKSKSLYDNISLFTGMNASDITKELNEKVKVLNYLVKKDISDVDGVGRIVAEYYTNKGDLMKYVVSGKDFPLASQLVLDTKPLERMETEPVHHDDEKDPKLAVPEKK